MVQLFNLRLLFETPYMLNHRFCPPLNSFPFSSVSLSSVDFSFETSFWYSLAIVRSFCCCYLSLLLFVSVVVLWLPGPSECLVQYQVWYFFQSLFLYLPKREVRYCLILFLLVFVSFLLLSLLLGV